MADELLFGLYIFVLAAFVGYQVITRVPPLLHTPLMSGTNAISGISLVGSLVAAGAHYNTVSTVLAPRPSTSVSRTPVILKISASLSNVIGLFRCLWGRFSGSGSGRPWV